MFFDDNLTDKVATTSPYSSDTTQRVRNNEDGIYQDDDGETMVVLVKFVGNDFTKGMTGEITLGVDPTATPAPTGFGGRPPPNGARPPGSPPNGPRPSRPPPPRA